MVVENIKRAFKYEDVELDDINPELPPEQILEHYCLLYPELTNATIKTKGLDERGMQRFEFDLNIGTKG